MNTLHLRYAVEVEKTRSITQAAEHLFMAQPNLSKAIRELEDSLGITIFERSSKGVIPTKKGSEFLVHAKSILAELDRVEALCREDAPDQQRFGISIARGSYISAAFTRFAAELDEGREMRLQVQETNAMQTIGSVADGHFHMGIIRYQNSYESYFLDYLAEKGLAFDPIWEFEMLVLMSERNPSAAVETVQAGDLRNYTEILHGDNMIPYLPPDAGQKRNEHAGSVKRRIYLYERCSQFDLLASIPTTFMWVSPIPEDLLERYQLVQRRCVVSGNRYKDLLIYPSGYRFSELDKRFIDKLYAEKNEVAFREYH